MPRVHEGVVPPNGWYVDLGKIIIRGDSYRDLVNNYVAHHKANIKGTLSPVELEKEVQAKLVDRWPEGNLERRL